MSRGRTKEFHGLLLGYSLVVTLCITSLTVFVAPEPRLKLQMIWLDIVITWAIVFCSGWFTSRRISGRLPITLILLGVGAIVPWLIYAVVDEPSVGVFRTVDTLRAAVAPLLIGAGIGPLVNQKVIARE